MDSIQNTLLFESEVSEVLTTSDGSELDIDCTVAYIDEAEKMTSAMLHEMTRVLEESQCGDKLEAVTQGHGFISFGSLVCAQVNKRTPHIISAFVDI